MKIEPIRSEAIYIKRLREVADLWNSTAPGTVERMDALIEVIEEYENRTEELEKFYQDVESKVS